MVGVGGRIYATRCHVCRRRKVKCDGSKPSCIRCEKSGMLCTGYDRSLDFAFFDGRSTTRVESSKRSSPAKCTNPQGVIAPLRWRNTVSDTWLNLPMQNSMQGAFAAPQYKTGFIVMLQDHYLPDMRNPSIGQGPCSNWIHTAYEMLSAKDSTMLSNSLLAMSLTLVGRDRGDQELMTTSVRHYSRALRTLQTGLKQRSEDQFQREINLITCIACATYEMIANASIGSATKHLHGFSALLQSIGVESLGSSTCRKVFYEYRVMDITIGLLARHGSFLSAPEWLDPPWGTPDDHKLNPLQTLIDHALKLPVLMEDWDKAVRQAEGLPPMEQNALNNFMQHACEIQFMLKEWESNLRGDATTQLYIAHLSGSRFNRNSGTEGAYPTISYQFPSFDIGAALVYFEAVQIFLAELLVQMAMYSQKVLKIEETTEQPTPEHYQIKTRELTAKSLERADRICQSLDYFFEKDKRMIGLIVILLPFEAARSLYVRVKGSGIADADQEAAVAERIRFCERVTEHIKAQGLLLW